MQCSESKKLNILTIGMNGVYLESYIKSLSSRVNITMDLLTISSQNLESNQINKVFYINPRPTKYSIINYPLRFIKSLILSFILLFKKYDIIHIQLFCPYNAYFLPLFIFGPPKIATFMGSDLAEIPKSPVKKFFQTLLLYCINVVHVQHSGYRNLFHKTFPQKKIPVEIARYGVPIDFNVIDDLTCEQLEVYKENILKISSEKISIVCGFYATPQKQHFYMIDELASLPCEILKKITAIFPLSGGSQYAQDVLKYALKKLPEHLETHFITHFLENNEVAMLRKCSDIVINISTHDCLSATMLESLYCNAILVNGKWLTYDILDEYDVYTYKLENTEIHMLEKALSEIINNISSYKRKTKNNPSLIRHIASWENNISDWISMYEKLLNI